MYILFVCEQNFVMTTVFIDFLDIKVLKINHICDQYLRLELYV